MPGMLTQSEIEETFGRFTYHDDPGGGITIETGWIAKHIVQVCVPKSIVIPGPGGRGTMTAIRIHRLVAPHLIKALADIVALASANREAMLRALVCFDGSFVPRHTLWRPNLPLSAHSWGIAIDFGASQFPYGSDRKRDPDLVELLSGHGFYPGQLFSTPDPMHFQFNLRS